MPQIEKPDDLQLIANHPVFCVCMTIACYDGNKKKVCFHFRVSKSSEKVTFPVIEGLAYWLSRRCSALYLTKKFVFMYQNWKNAGQNQSSRETFFVRHSIYFKRKTGLFSRSLFDCFNPLMASLMMISGIVDYFQMEYLANDNRISFQHRKIFWIVWNYQFSMLIA